MMNVWIVKPPSYTHAESVRHVAQAFADAFGSELTVGSIPPDGDTLVFCGHLLGSVEPNMIIYNSEQIGPDWFHANPNCKNYINIMKAAKEVWDYSRDNIGALKMYGVIARLVEIGYMPSMTKNFPDHDQSIDVLFYGSTSADRRLKIIHELEGQCKLHVAYNVYGDELDKLISKSKIVLNMHFYQQAIHEIFRTSYLMANAKCVVSEVGRDKLLDGAHANSIFFTGYDLLVNRCEVLLRSPTTRKFYEKMAFERFREKTQVEILKDIGVL